MVAKTPRCSSRVTMSFGLIPSFSANSLTVEPSIRRTGFSSPGTGMFHPAGDAVFERQSLRRWNEIALIEPSGFAFNLSTPARTAATRTAAAGIRRRNVGGLWSGSFARRSHTFRARAGKDAL